MNKISVCTIYAKRELHLQNLVKGLIQSSDHPDELVIVCMNDCLPDLPATPFKILTATINTEDTKDTKDNVLPLAAARNKAAAMARGDKLIFLDVDCISDRNLIRVFNYHLEQEDALYSGSVRYLEQNWQTTSWTFDSLYQQSSTHDLQGITPAQWQKKPHPYELFWSLNFGMRKQTFEELKGFDRRYHGYGGEDTDFAFTARSHQLPHYKISALAYHQFHPSFAPPLHHLTEIVNNARVFAQKWHIFPMEKWLKQFAAMGYIELTDEITIVKYPTAAEIQASNKL